MNSIEECGIVFAIVFGSALGGMRLRQLLPQNHLSSDSKDAIKMAMTLLVTTDGIVLGLLIASSKSFYDTQTSELAQGAAQVKILDHTLARYGPEARQARDELRASVVSFLDRTWSHDPSRTSALEPAASSGERVYDLVEQLSPQNDTQRLLRAQAFTLMTGLGQARWLMYEQTVVGLPPALLVTLIVWLSIIFVSFGVIATPNASVIVSLLFSALAVSGAILLILEMYDPYQGLIQVSSAPLRAVLEHLGR